jgi:hypothetical protein
MGFNVYEQASDQAAYDYWTRQDVKPVRKAGLSKAQGDMVDVVVRDMAGQIANMVDAYALVIAASGKGMMQKASPIPFRVSTKESE